MLSFLCYYFYSRFFDQIEIVKFTNWNSQIHSMKLSIATIKHALKLLTIFRLNLIMFLIFFSIPGFEFCWKQFRFFLYIEFHFFFRFVIILNPVIWKFSFSRITSTLLNRFLIAAIFDFATVFRPCQSNSELIMCEDVFWFPWAYRFSNRCYVSNSGPICRLIFFFLMPLMKFKTQQFRLTYK